MFTPLRNPTTAPERKYNKAQIRTRNIIEITFGLWKRRFSCLRRSLANAPQTIVNIIITCALLHNMAQKYNTRDDDSHSEEEEEEEGEDRLTFPVEDIQNNIIADATRTAYILRHFN